MKIGQSVQNQLIGFFRSLIPMSNPRVSLSSSKSDPLARLSQTASIAKATDIPATRVAREPQGPRRCKLIQMKLPVLFSACLSLLILGCSSPAPSPSVKMPEGKPPVDPHALGEAAAEVDVDIRTLIDQPAPPYEFVFADGGQKKSTDLKGKTVLLSFFATWDANSKPVSAQLQKWHDSFGDKGLVVIGVNTFEVTDPGADKNKRIVDSAEASAAFAKGEKATYSFATYGDATAKRWSIGGVPAFVLVDKIGNLIAFESNAKPETMAKLEKLITTDVAK